MLERRYFRVLTDREENRRFTDVRTLATYFKILNFLSPDFLLLTLGPSSRQFIGSPIGNPINQLKTRDYEPYPRINTITVHLGLPMMQSAVNAMHISRMSDCRANQRMDIQILRYPH